MRQDEATLSEIRAQIEGRQAWWRIGRDFPMIARESRTNHWGLTGPSFCTIIEANDGPFSDQFQPDIGATKIRY